jgi:cyclic pyranopterin phosphate synthase
MLVQKFYTGHLRLQMATSFFHGINERIMKKLTHINRRGEMAMVDISHKPVTNRRAVAAGEIQLTRAIARAIQSGSVAKGNVLEAARIGAIQAAKKTAELIPLCHPLPISDISVRFRLNGMKLHILADVKAEAKTGVEMEALTAVSVAALVVYDMCKGIDKGMIIGPVELLEKEGGKSGYYKR